MSDIHSDYRNRPKHGTSWRFRVLMTPGLGLKRWIILLFIGLGLLSLGVGFVMAMPINSTIGPVVRATTFSNLPLILRGALFIGVGSLFVLMAAYYIYGWIITGASHKSGDMDILTAMDIVHRRSKGPKIVAIGGGTGVSTLLRGLKYQTANLTAIVTIADDGGSSGRLRDDFHMPPPGDARNCLIALSEAGPIMEELFDYRFESDSNLDGHNLGNLLLAALSQTRGGFRQVLDAAARLLAVSGKVEPVSNNVELVLMGETISGHVLRGETSIGHSPEKLERVWIVPDSAVANRAAIDAIDQADMIVIGPGSLYTSVIPNLLFKAIRDSVNASNAPKVFVCNVATQPYETDGYGVEQHLNQFQSNTGVSVSHLLINDMVLNLPKHWDQEAVLPVNTIDGFHGNIVHADVLNEDFPTRHDPYKLARVLISIERNCY